MHLHLQASTDQSEVDTNFAPQIGSFAFSVIQLLGIIAVMSQVAWQVFVLFVPVIAICIWYQVSLFDPGLISFIPNIPASTLSLFVDEVLVLFQRYYIDTARELARLVGVCNAPIIQHFAESISGVTTIRSFSQESRFVDTNFRLSDEYSRPKFYNAGAREWLCFRLDMLSSITFAFSLIFLISVPKGFINPGKHCSVLINFLCLQLIVITFIGMIDMLLPVSAIAGLAVTYGLNLNMLQAWVIWTLCNLENKVISVERILQYTSIPSEPPLTVEENRPSSNWPSMGEVELHDVQVIIIDIHHFLLLLNFEPS